MEANTLERAQEHAAAYPFLVSVVVLDRPSQEECAELRAFILSLTSCEWMGILEGNTRPAPHVRRLILDCLFDYHTQPIDPAFFCRELGHAFGLAQLRKLAGEDPGDEAGHAARLHAVRLAAEKAALVRALIRTHNNVTAAASELAVSRITMYRLISKHRIPLNRNL